MLHVVLDLVRLWREASLLKVKKPRTEEEISDRETLWEAKWRREMVVNMAWAPLTLHWSLEKGFVNDFWVGLLGSVAGLAGLRELLKNTAKA